MTTDEEYERFIEEMRMMEMDHDFGMMPMHHELEVEEPIWVHAPHPVEYPLNVQETRDKIIENISLVHDPEIPINIWDLGLIYDVQVDENGCCDIVMTLTTPNCPSAQTLPEMVQKGATMVPGIKMATLELTFDPIWGPDKMSEDAKLALGID